MRWSVQGRLAVVVTAAVMLAAAVAPVGPGPVPAVPLAMAVLVLAACVVAWCWVVRRPSLAPAAFHSARVDLERNPVRQCDPDSAGHVRPRAPGARR